jgi:hypothetical protein
MGKTVPLQSFRMCCVAISLQLRQPKQPSTDKLCGLLLWWQRGKCCDATRMFIIRKLLLTYHRALLLHGRLACAPLWHPPTHTPIVRVSLVLDTPVVLANRPSVRTVSATASASLLRSQSDLPVLSAVQANPLRPLPGRRAQKHPALAIAQRHVSSGLLARFECAAPGASSVLPRALRVCCPGR